MDKFDRMSSLFGIQLEQIKAIAEAFAAVNPEKDGWFVGSIAFKLEGGRVTHVDETKIVRATQNEAVTGGPTITHVNGQQWTPLLSFPVQNEPPVNDESET